MNDGKKLNSGGSSRITANMSRYVYLFLLCSKPTNLIFNRAKKRRGGQSAGSDLITPTPEASLEILDQPELTQSSGAESIEPIEPADTRAPSPEQLPPPAAGVYPERPAGPIANELLPEPDVAIDPRSPYAVWGSGEYLTRLPYIPNERHPDRNALKVVSRTFSGTASTSHRNNFS